MRHLALAFGLRTEALRATLSFGRLVGMGGSGLGRRLEATIGLVVAATLGCSYMGVHHAHALIGAGATPDEVQAIVEDPAGGTLTGREGAAARFCDKLTRQPGDMALSDVEALRDVGLDDRDIMTVAVSASYESFICGVAAGLGVRLEEAPFAPTALEVFA